MVNISDRSVDLILCDLPFGNSGFGWDRPIDLVSLRQNYRRIIKPNYAIALFVVVMEFSACPETTQVAVLGIITDYRES
jgi:hypothetical protein